MKKLVFSIIAICLSGFAFSQTFMQGIGINVVVQSAPGISTLPVGGIMYSPRINFMEADNTSFSVGIPMSFGITGSYNSQDVGDNSLGYMFDIPLMINYNYGAGATKEVEDKFGFFAGAGFGFHAHQYVTTDDLGYDYTAKMSGFGPVGNLGVRLGVGHRSHNLELRFSYMKTLDISKSNIMGFGLLFNF
jgi:hypothetical protein